MNIVIKKISNKPYVGIRRWVKPQDIGTALTEILPAVANFLKKEKVAPISPPITIYHAHDENKGEMEIQGGFFLSESIESSEHFEAGVISAGEIACAIHMGPYEKLGDTHSVISAWVIEQNREPGCPSWEVYLNDPGEVKDPNLYQTEVSLLLK